MRAALGLAAALLWVAGWSAAADPAAPADSLTSGSKKFTESVILGEISAHLIAQTGTRPMHRRELGGTRVLWEALLKGDIDLYPEYTGTIAREIMQHRNLRSDEEIRQALEGLGIGMTRPLGFNNTYAIGMREEVAEKYGIRTISDLARHPDLKLGFGNEFMDRGDGWPALRARYGLTHRNARGLDHDLAYRGLESGDVEAMDVYSTDAEIAYYGLRVLEDDLKHFPAYDSVILYRADLARRAPAAVAAIKRLEGRIDAARMSAMNAAVKIDKQSETKTAAAFLAAEFKLVVAIDEETMGGRLWRNTLDHLWLVALSLGAAILVSIPLGILAQRMARFGQVILGLAGILQTIPSLALFVFMIPLLGIGGPPAMVALFLYSLLPIIRNTHAGLSDIAPSIRQSAEALGLPPLARLRLVELPLAARSILAGIKTSAVINVGTATLGALIGAGGYGQPILTGIRLDDMGLILQGAVPAALLALLAQGLFELAERMVIAKGLRLKPQG